MKIVYEGSNVVSWCTERHIARTLADMGHEMVFVPTGSISTRELEQLIAREQPDLVMLTQPWGKRSSTDRCILDCCASQGIPTAGFHLDLFWGLPEREQWVRRHSEPLFDCAMLFTPDGDHQDDWQAAGVNHQWLPAGVFAPECYDAEPDPAWAGVKVAFVGSAPNRASGNYHHEWPHRAQLVQKLDQWYGDSFVHIGNGGAIPFLRGHDLNRFYASVDLVVGDSCFTSPERTYTSDRVFESWGRGAYLIHPRIDWLDAAIGPLPSWDVGNWEQLHDGIEGALADAGHREEVRARIASKVRAEHTYTQRLEAMLSTLGLECKAVTA